MSDTTMLKVVLKLVTKTKQHLLKMLFEKILDSIILSSQLYYPHFIQ